MSILGINGGTGIPVYPKKPGPRGREAGKRGAREIELFSNYDSGCVVIGLPASRLISNRIGCNHLFNSWYRWIEQGCGILMGHLRPLCSWESRNKYPVGEGLQIVVCLQDSSENSWYAMGLIILSSPLNSPCIISPEEKFIATHLENEDATTPQLFLTESNSAYLRQNENVWPKMRQDVCVLMGCHPSS